MRNPTGSKRVKRAFDVAKEDGDTLRNARRCERRAIKADTRAQVEEYFEEQIIVCQELEDMLMDDATWEAEYEARLRDRQISDDFFTRARAANRWADEYEQTHYFENGRWMESEEDPFAYADDLLRP